MPLHLPSLTNQYGLHWMSQEPVGDAYEWAIDNVIPVLCDPQGPPPTWFEELEVIEGPSDACVFFERR